MLITYCFEYAQTEKSKCTECNKVIKRHGLRVGELSRFSKKVKKSMANYRWWHFDCFKMVEKILEITPEKIRGYDKLSDIDKQRIGELAKLGVDATWYNVPENIRNELDKKAKQSKPKDKPKAKKETGKKSQQQQQQQQQQQKNVNTNKKEGKSAADAKAKPKPKIIKKAKTTGPSVGGLNENKINDAIRQISKKLNNKQGAKKNNNNNNNNNNNKKQKIGGNAKGGKGPGAKTNNKSKGNAASKNDAILSKLKKKIQSKNTKITKKKN